jgi:hypothetical protein
MSSAISGTRSGLEGKPSATESEIRRDTLLTQLLNGIPAVIITGIALWVVASPERRANAQWVFWYVPAVALLHTMEEYVWPGGFVRWFNTIAFGSKNPNAPLSARRALLTDASAAIAIVPALVFFGASVPLLVMIFAAVLLVNAFFHICETIKTGVYSPGTVTAIALYLPVLTWVAYFYVSNELVSVVQLVFAFAMGLGFTALFFFLVRKWMKEPQRNGEGSDKHTPTAA